MLGACRRMTAAFILGLYLSPSVLGLVACALKYRREIRSERDQEQQARDHLYGPRIGGWRT